jgi:PAS domain S-box-containing protein
MAKKKTGEGPGPKTAGGRAVANEIAALKRRLEEAEDALGAIQTGAVDALVVRGPQGDQIYSLKDADRPYRAVIENMRDGALSVRADGLILYANRQFAAMLGRPLESLLGRDLFAYVDPNDRPALQGLLDSALPDGAHGNMEFMTDSRKPLLVHVSLAPLKIDGTKVLAGVVADMTEERQAQLRLRQIERMEALGRLAGGVAHDLNNILQPIVVNAELLLEGTEPGSQRRDMLNNIIAAATRQKGLVKRILSFTRPIAQVLRPLSVTPLVVEAVNLLKPSLPGNIDIRLTSNSAADIIKGDATEIHELVTNLCSNAVDAMELAGGTVEVSVQDLTLTRESPAFDLKPGRYLKLAVKDTGVGIPPGDLDRIFDPFFTTKEVGKGTGIGLSIVRGIVKNHGGSITVQSRVRQGTEMTVFLPVAAALPLQADRNLRDLERKASGRRILVVDDEELVLDTVRRALMSFGHLPTTVNDPAAALAMLQTMPGLFDMAIIDQNMPKMTGLKLAAEIRRINPAMPILLATGYSKTVEDRSLQASGVTAVVMKPLDLKDLASAINDALESGRTKS